MALDIKSLQEFADRLCVSVTDYDLLGQALTHGSYLGEVESATSNERLEFLGDSVLGLVIAEYLYSEFPDRAEGDLAKAKAVAVSEPVLAESAKQLGLDEMILMSSGEEAGGGRKRLSILSDAFEAVVAVIYLDSGMEEAREFILRALAPILADIERREHIRDYKSLLQEQTQGIYKEAPRYVVISEHGADHDKTFVIEATLQGTPIGCGEGKSKKQAEQAAAQQGLRYMEQKFEAGSDEASESKGDPDL